MGGIQGVHLDADRADLHGRSNLVLPPNHFKTSKCDRDLPNLSKSHMANPHEEVCSSSEESLQVPTPLSTPPDVTKDDFAFAFDIDGVLIRGGKAIPEALEAMKYINGENPYGIKV